MMAVAAYSDLREQVRYEADDMAAIRWTDAELDRYIQAGQREYVLRRMELKGSVAITGDGIADVFTAPPDCLQPYSFVDGDGHEVPIYSFRQLADNFTAKFIADTGNKNIHICCLNFNNWNQIRFYPRLATGVGGTLYYWRLPLNDEIEIDEYALKFYVLWRMYLRESDADYVNKSMYYRDLFTKQVYQIANRGRMVILPTAPELPTFDEIRQEVRTLLQDESAEVWNNNKLNNYLDEAQGQFARHARCLKKSFDMAPHVNGRFYYPEDHIETIYAWNERDMTIVPTSERKLRRAYGAAALTETGMPENIYEGDSTAEYKLFPATAETVTIPEYSPYLGWFTLGDIICGAWEADSESMFAELLDDWRHEASLICFDDTVVLFESWGSDNPLELGVVRYIEGAEFDSEDGAISAIYDDDPAIAYHTALSEYGGCDVLFEHNHIGSMQYVRQPYRNTMEIRNPDALLWYAAAKCLEEDREHKDLKKAVALRQAFQDCINFETKVNSRQNGHRITGSFF